MVESATKKFQQFKNKTPEIKWNIDLQMFAILRTQIDSIELVTSDKQITMNSNFF